MKVLFITVHLLSGGAERTISYLSGYLADHNAQVSVLSLSADRFYALQDAVAYETLHVPTDAPNAAIRLFNIVRRYVGTAKCLLRQKPDVVFCLLSDTAQYALWLKPLLKFRLITSERNNPAATKDLNTMRRKQRIFRKSDGIVFQTRRAMEFYPPDIQARGCVIPNAVGNELVYQAQPVTQRAHRIAAIGRLAPQKNYPLLFAAFAEVLKKHPDYVLDIYGDGPDKKKLMGLAEELHIAEHVVFKGACRDAILQASTASCYVLSSDFEGMPNALMEAMAVGLPCVSTDCPNGPAELIENGRNGVLVPVGDAAAMATAILRMIEEPAFADSCGATAKQILQTHGLRENAEKYRNYIMKVYDKND